MLSVRSVASRADLRSRSGLNACAALVFASDSSRVCHSHAPVPCAAVGEVSGKVEHACDAVRGT